MEREDDLREITTHRTGSPVNDCLRVLAGRPEGGGAPAIYHVKHADGINCLAIPFHTGEMDTQQDGAKRAKGVTIEALVAVCADRLAEWQKGPFACVDNEQALYLLRNALVCLGERTRGRKERGVEGQQVP